MADLTSVTTNALMEELHNRGVEVSRPPLIKHPDLSALVAVTESLVKSVEDGSYHEDDDTSHYIYEAAMEAMYGKGFFKWFNAKTS